MSGRGDGVGAGDTAAAETGGNAEIERYMAVNWNAEVARGIPYPARSPRLVLRGSWHAMGTQ